MDDNFLANMTLLGPGLHIVCEHNRLAVTMPGPDAHGDADLLLSYPGGFEWATHIVISAPAHWHAMDPDGVEGGKGHVISFIGRDECVIRMITDDGVVACESPADTIGGELLDKARAILAKVGPDGS